MKLTEDIGARFQNVRRFNNLLFYIRLKEEIAKSRQGQTKTFLGNPVAECQFGTGWARKKLSAYVSYC